MLLALACATDPEPTEPPAEPRRIVAVAPAISEILFALGLGERVVAVGDYAEWPPEVRELPRLGGLHDPRLELAASLEPDLAVLLPNEEELARRLRHLGVEVLTVPLETVDDIPRAVRRIAARSGVPERGESVAGELEERLAPRPLPDAPRVLLTIGREPGRLSGILTAGPGNFLDELLARLGARNLFADSPISYPEVGLEEILARRPEAIVELHPEELPEVAIERLRADWRRMAELPAVEGERIHVLTGSHTVLPGPRLPLLYEALEEALR